jgi:hypothetical protein
VPPSPHASGSNASKWPARRWPICAPSSGGGDDPYADRDDLLGAIDRDVLIVFVESYGRASLDTPLYADTHRATLQAAEARLARSGCRCARGCCARPRRRAKLAEPRDLRQRALDRQSDELWRGAGQRPPTLFHIASDAGFRTAAVMPQITLDWPESR